MSALNELLQNLWKDYSRMNKQADGIYKLLEDRGEKIINDHIAFRTYNLPKISIPVLAKPFLDLGYEKKGEYQFKAKKLYAQHFEHPDSMNPRIFISELKVEEFSGGLQSVVKELVDQIPEEATKDPQLSLAGRLWDPISYETYLRLKEESEYAAWMAVHGFRVNHFTVLINGLKTFDKLKDFNEFIKANGYSMNSSGGEIKGTPEECLEQSSTMAHTVEVEFSDGVQAIPGCYYEFAKRYPMPDGQLFMGFIAKSADKIFESTDNK